MLGNKILEILGVVHSGSAGGWLSCSCLFASHRHSGGVDSKPSATFNPTGNGYKCYACGTSATSAQFLLRELRNLNEEKGISNDRVRAALAYALGNSTVHGNGLCDSDLPVAPHCHSDRPFKPFPKEVIAKMYPVLSKRSSGAYVFPEAIQYLISRKVPEQVIADFDMRWDHDRHRIVVPSFLKGKTLANLHGRLVNLNPEIVGLGTPPRYLEYGFKPTPKAPDHYNVSVWFRQSKLSQKAPLIVCEGMFDAARVYQSYRNVTAMLGVNASSAKQHFLHECKEIILIPDNDDSGEKSAMKLKQLFPHIKIIPVPYPFKDAGEMSAVDVREMLLPHVALDSPIWTKKDAETYKEGVEH